MAAISPAAAWGILFASAIAAVVGAVLLLRGPYWVVRRVHGDPVAFWTPGAVVIGMLVTFIGLIAAWVVYVGSIDFGVSTW